MTETLKKCWHYPIIAMVAALSFYFLSPLTSYIFHSDIAIHVLMTYDLRLPSDLYYWGQDRLGSAVPVLGHLIYKIFHLSPVLSASLSQYFFLMVGYFSFASLLKTKFSKIIFAIAWFFPPIIFQELIQLGQPYGAQSCFIGLAVVSLRRTQKPGTIGTRRETVFFFLGISAIMISVWISDLSIVALALFVPLFAKWYKNRSRVTIILNGILLIAVVFSGVLFIHYARGVRPRSDDYSTHIFGGRAEILSNISSRARAVADALLFHCGDVLLSCYGVVITAGLIILVILFFRKKGQPDENRDWRIFFLLFSFICTSLLFSSYWVFHNFSANRYFTPVYFAGNIAVLMTLETISGSGRNGLQLLFFLAALFAAASSVAPHYNAGTSKEKFSRLEEFRKLGRIGIIGTYWRSYYIAAADPENIVATPHEGEYIRCPYCVDSVMERPVIYLVQDDWLDSLPRTVLQFGKKLRRVEEPHKINGLTIAAYRVAGPAY
jgi:hypothetical protein